MSEGGEIPDITTREVLEVIRASSFEVARWSCSCNAWTASSCALVCDVICVSSTSKAAAWRCDAVFKASSTASFLTCSATFRSVSSVVCICAVALWTACSTALAMDCSSFAFRACCCSSNADDISCSAAHSISTNANSISCWCCSANFWVTFSVTASVTRWVTLWVTLFVTLLVTLAVICSVTRSVTSTLNCSISFFCCNEDDSCSCSSTILPSCSSFACLDRCAWSRPDICALKSDCIALIFSSVSWTTSATCCSNTSLVASNVSIVSSVCWSTRVRSSSCSANATVNWSFSCLTRS